MNGPTPDALWRFDLFGGFAVRCGGAAPLPLPPHKPNAFLAYLAFHAGKSCPRNRLLTQFWADEGMHAPEESYRKALQKVRQTLCAAGGDGTALLRADRAGARLCAEAVTTDVAEFLSALRDAGVGAGPVARRDALARATDLYRGDLLEGYGDAWIVPERARLARAHREALCALSQALREGGDLPAATEAARRAVGLESSDEEAGRALMQCHADTGNVAEAVGEYERLRRALWASCQAPPSPPTQELARAIRTRRVAGVAPVAAPPAAPPAAPDPHQAAKPTPPAPPAPRRALLVAGAAALAAAVGSGGALLRRAAAPAASPADGLYSEGRAAWDRRGAQNLERAAQRFAEALRRDPRSARAHAGLADALSLQAFYGFLPPAEVLPRAEASARRAVGLAASPAARQEAYTSLAWVETLQWRWAAAESHFRAALREPGAYPTAHMWYSLALMVRGAGDNLRENEGLIQITKALGGGRRSPIVLKSFGQRYFFTGDYPSARRSFEEAMAAPGGGDFYLTRYWLGLTLEQMGDTPRALAEFGRAAALCGRADRGVVAAEAHAAALAGDAERARGALRELEAARAAWEAGRGPYASPVALATARQGFADAKKGDAAAHRAAALRELEQGLAERSGDLMTVSIDPRFAGLRNAPVFRRLQDRVRRGGP